MTARTKMCTLRRSHAGKEKTARVLARVNSHENLHAYVLLLLLLLLLLRSRTAGRCALIFISNRIIERMLVVCTPAGRIQLVFGLPSATQLLAQPGCEEPGIPAPSRRFLPQARALLAGHNPSCIG